MIIDDSISFFGVYFHNCILNLGLSKSFADLYSSNKYKSVVLCQKDNKNGYLLTQSILTENQKDLPNMRSYYFADKKALKEGYKNISDRIDSSDKIFYLLRSNFNSDFNDSEAIVAKWKEEISDEIK